MEQEQDILEYTIHISLLQSSQLIVIKHKYSLYNDTATCLHGGSDKNYNLLVIIGKKKIGF